MKTKLVIVVFVMGILILTGCVNQTALEKVSDLKENQIESQREYITESLAELHSEWGSYTKAKKESEWSKYEGKYVKWQAYVKQIDTAWHVEYHLLGTISSSQSIGSDVGVYFNEDQIESLIEFNKGDLVTFEGKLKKYGSPISSNIFYVTDGMLLDSENFGKITEETYQENKIKLETREDINNLKDIRDPKVCTESFKEDNSYNNLLVACLVQLAWINVDPSYCDFLSEERAIECRKTLITSTIKFKIHKEKWENQYIKMCNSIPKEEKFDKYDYDCFFIVGSSGGVKEGCELTQYDKTKCLESYERNRASN